MNPPPTSSRMEMTAGHALWKLERCLSWYGLEALNITRFEPRSDFLVQAEASGAGVPFVLRAEINRLTGRLHATVEKTAPRAA